MAKAPVTFPSECHSLQPVPLHDSLKCLCVQLLHFARRLLECKLKLQLWLRSLRAAGGGGGRGRHRRASHPAVRSECRCCCCSTRSVVQPCTRRSWRHIAPTARTHRRRRWRRRSDRPAADHQPASATRVDVTSCQRPIQKCRQQERSNVHLVWHHRLAPLH